MATDMDKAMAITCQGCENECEVFVTVQADVLICLGGNICPTGERFALAQCREKMAKGIPLQRP